MTITQFNRVAISLEELKKAKIDAFKSAAAQAKRPADITSDEMWKEAEKDPKAFVKIARSTWEGDHNYGHIRSALEMLPEISKSRVKRAEADAKAATRLSDYIAALNDKIRTTLDSLYLDGDAKNALDDIKAFQAYEPKIK